MESSKNRSLNMLLPENQFAAFDAFKEKLASHIEMIKHHLIYLTKIQARLMPEDDISEYLKDVLGFKVPENGKFRTEYLPELLSSLKQKMEIFLELLTISKNHDRQVSISTLYLALQSEVAHAKNMKKMAIMNKVHIESKMQTILNDVNLDFVTDAVKYLKKILPATHSQLEHVVSISMEKEIKYNKKRNVTSTSFCSSFKINWDNFNNELIATVKKNTGTIKPAQEDHDLINKFKEGRLKKSQGGCLSDESHKIIMDIVSLFEIISVKVQQRIALNKQLLESKNDSNHFTLLFVNVSDYYEIQPLYVQLSELFNYFIDQNEKIKKLNQLYHHAKDNVKREHDFYNQRCKYIRDSVNKISRKKKWMQHQTTFDQILNDISAIEITISELMNIFPSIINENWTDNVIDDKLLLTQDMGGKILDRLRELEEKYLECFNAPAIQTQCSPSPSPSPSSSINYHDEQENEREKFLIARKKLNEEYRLSVEKERNEKLKKNRNRESVLTGQEVVETISIVYKNLDMEDRLINMSTHAFALLKSILNLERNILYTDVYHLICNQLDGEIEEIGNGSSHKRIRIAKYYAEVYSHSSETAPDTNGAPSQAYAGGGFFRPHGKAHQPGLMSRFNMELVVNTFKKAGITTSLLSEIEQKRAARPTTFNY